MYKKFFFLAIIPARAGSKRILNKNLQLIGNKPLVQFTIEAAISAIGRSNIIVSSNDVGVHKIARKLGLKIPFIRPSELSTGKATTQSVIFHALQWHKKHKGFLPDNFILLQPTSPLRTANDIKRAIRQFIISKKKTLVSVCSPTQNPNDFLIKNKFGKFEKLKIFKDKKKLNKRNQNPEIYFIDGGIYISNTNYFVKTGDMIGHDPEIFLTSPTHGIDIDTLLDLELARLVYKKQKLVR